MENSIKGPPAKFKGAKINNNCEECPSRTLSQFAATTDEEMEKISGARNVQYLQRGQFLFIQGQLQPGIYCISSGTFALSREVPGVGSVLLRLVHGGETLGYRNMINNSICTNSARAVENSTVCHIDAEVFHTLKQNNPNLAERFLASLAEEVDHTEESLVELVLLPVRSRLARLLLMLVGHYGREHPVQGTELRPPMTWRDLSELINTRPETFTRTMHAMENDGLFRHRGHLINIPDLNALKAEANAV